MSFNRTPLLARLALQDLWHDRTISFCIISSLVAVIAPLLLLFGLRFGIVSQLQDDLAKDPRNLEIRMLSSNSYDQAWIEQLQQRPDVGFAIGQTRSLNTLADLQTDSTHFIESAEVIPTASGDPLLGSLILRHDNEVVLTQEAARKLAVSVGETIDLRVNRLFEERREWGRQRLTVVGILPATYFNRPAIFTRPTLLLMLEHFRDGFATRPSASAAATPSATCHRAMPAPDCTPKILIRWPVLSAISGRSASKPPAAWQILKM
ncbi:hypothetical protein ERHA55_00880 [Erwinia rhapontici]|nr:ABC transporter permease [Erwinia rhapontici]BCQ42561.1 hypothetical protein ERHA55_00880 [Erwinia rhapontici]